MSKSFEIQGELHSIGDTQEFGSNGFTKREFVLLVTGEDENPAYPNYVALELIKDKCALMDKYNLGEEVVVTFNLSGRLWNAPGKPEKCFTSLQAWRVETASKGVGNAPAMNNEPFKNNDFNGFDDDVPF